MANTIQIKRKTTTGAPALGSLSDGELCLVVPDSNLYLRVDGSTLLHVNGGGSVDMKPYCATGSGTDVTTTEATVALTVEQITDANYSLSGNEITISEAGTYNVSYAIELDDDGTEGGTRRRVNAHMHLDGVLIVQSQNAVYTRESSGGSGISNAFNVTVAADEVLRLRVKADATAPDQSVESAQVSITKIG